MHHCRDSRSILGAIERTSGVAWGAILLGFAALLLAVAVLSVKLDQALSPGEENLGLGIVLLIFGFAALISGLLGLGFFIEAAIYRMRGRKLPD